MTPAPAALSVRGLTVCFRLPRATVRAVTDVSFDLAPGECVALVGESGCGKSVMAAALLGLLPGNALVGGSATLPGGLDLLTVGERELARHVRGRRIGLVPQSPAAHLTPVRTVRAQLEETVRELTGERARTRAAAEAAAERAAYPVDHLDRYPHELSGGLAQRAALALALVGDPGILVADEPTTGLDRPLVMRTVDELRRVADSGRAVLLVTHDLAAAERVADRVAVMYAGRLAELASAARFFARDRGPRHPYAAGLLDALPDRAFTAVPGMPPALTDLPPGCAFAPRCGRAGPDCHQLPSWNGEFACHRPLGEEAGVR